MNALTLKIAFVPNTSRFRWSCVYWPCVRVSSVGCAVI